MRSLFSPAPVEKHGRLPQGVRDLIRTLKAEYPALRPNEIATICSFRSPHHPSPHTVKRVLAEEPPLAHVVRQFPPYHQIADPVDARLALVRLHAQGWNVKSIAGYMGVDRHTVYAALRRWFVEGVAGLPDKAHARPDGMRKVDLRAMRHAKSALRRLSSIRCSPMAPGDPTAPANHVAATSPHLMALVQVFHQDWELDYPDASAAVPAAMPDQARSMATMRSFFVGDQLR